MRRNWAWHGESTERERIRANGAIGAARNQNLLVLVVVEQPGRAEHKEALLPVLDDTAWRKHWEIGEGEERPIAEK